MWIGGAGGGEGSWPFNSLALSLTGFDLRGLACLAARSEARSLQQGFLHRARRVEDQEVICRLLILQQVV